MKNIKDYECVISIVGSVRISNEDEYDFISNRMTCGLLENNITYLTNIQQYCKSKTDCNDVVLNDNVILEFRFPMTTNEFMGSIWSTIQNTINKLFDNCEFDVCLRIPHVTIHNKNYYNYIYSPDLDDNGVDIWKDKVVTLTMSKDNTVSLVKRNVDIFETNDDNKTYDYVLLKVEENYAKCKKICNYIKDKDVSSILAVVERLVDSQDEPVEVFNVSDKIKHDGNNRYTNYLDGFKPYVDEYIDYI